MYEEDFTPHDTVGAIIRNENGEIFTLYHNKYKLHSIPIGKTIKGEKAEDAIKRELKEELNLDNIEVKKIKHSNLTYILDHKILQSNAVLFEVIHCDITQIKNNEVDKHQSFTFLSLEQLIGLKCIDKLTELSKVAIDYILDFKHITK